MRILVIGKSGQLARALAHTAPDDAGVSFLGRDSLDLAIAGAASKAITERRPNLVINAAAYTAVDGAEEASGDAFRINADAVGEIARATSTIDAALLHISTDYVFDGTKDGPYVETDPTGPGNIYGASKLAGEAAALQGNPRCVILRTSWVYSPWAKNFVLSMLKLAQTHPQLRVVDDQHGCPTSALDLANACLSISDRLIRADAGDPLWGVYHYAAGGVCSWADFAARIFDQAQRLGGGPVPQIERIGAVDFPARAARPANSALDCRKFVTTFGIEPVPWPRALARVMGLLMEGRDTCRASFLPVDRAPAAIL